MGFPVGYSELPNLILHLIFILAHIRKLINWTLNSLGLSNLLDSEAQWNDNNFYSNYHYHHQLNHNSLLADTIQESMPVIKFEELLNHSSLPDNCAVCLYEFEGTDEVRRLHNCSHVFHRLCVDRWVEHGQCTCPLCRSPFITEDVQDSGCAIATSAGSSYVDDYFHYYS